MLIQESFRPFGCSVCAYQTDFTHIKCILRVHTGLINNVLYVVILSAALDLVGPDFPKGFVLLCDVVPSFFVKLLAPYFIQSVPYSARVITFSLLSAWGMLLIALTPPYTDGGAISTKMAGVVLASLSSGAGELSFLGLVHYYGQFSLAAWGSGTGGAGLIGAGAYALATTSMGLSVKSTLFASAFLPIVMLLSFFVLLPREPLNRSMASTAKTEAAVTPSMENEDIENERLLRDEEDISPDPPSLSQSMHERQSESLLQQLRTNLRRSSRLFLPL